MDVPPPSTIAGLRELFTRNERDELPPDLRRALTLLQLEDLDGLEDRFLATEAFLKPWATFRDSVLFLWPDAMPRATLVKKEDAVAGIARTDILWFYTRYDEDSKRYDAHADWYSDEYTSDSSVYGVIDKREWSIEAYEKHMYAWLAQEFRVGKVRNPWGFDFFQLQSVCVAWEAVFVPIVNAVRASYDAKGRRHYGRLALFVESVYPSRLAFPENNVGMTRNEMLSPTPFRIVSHPKKVDRSDRAAFAQQSNRPGVLTKKHYDETEKELRDVYPQYGGLVERPKFKQKMEEWLAEQRVRADARKALERHGEVQRFRPQIVQRGEDMIRPMDKSLWTTPPDDGASPMKRKFHSIRRTISRNLPRRASKELPKGPLHGVTRQLHFSEEDLSDLPPSMQQPLSDARRKRCVSQSSSSTVLVTPWPRAEANRRASEQSVYASIRNSNPFVGDSPSALRIQRKPSPELTPELPPTGLLDTVGRLMRDGDEDEDEDEDAQHPALKSESLPYVSMQNSPKDIRLPSYEGTGYMDEISHTKLHAVREQSVTPRPKRSTKPPTRLPIPIKPMAYNGNLRIVHKKPGAFAPPEPVPWPGSEDEDGIAPPVPKKNPKRGDCMDSKDNGARSKMAVDDESHAINRIVSKANIRAAVGRNSRGSSSEDLTPPMPLPSIRGPARVTSPGGIKLRTYNSHLFPRKPEDKNMSLRAWTDEQTKRVESGGSYEMELL